MTKIYLTDDEWKTAKNISDKHNTVLRNIGRLKLTHIKIQKEIEQEYSELESFEEMNKSFYDQLVEKYGQGDIDTDTGEFIKKENV